MADRLGVHKPVKEERLTMRIKVLTVSALAVSNRPAVPFIRLRGKWLQVLGFGVGQKITVEESEGQLILRVVKEG
jgi:hypothetical protein